MVRWRVNHNLEARGSKHRVLAPQPLWVLNLGQGREFQNIK